MKEKGFTLIELLAVIVILAIIALIATPLVMDVIDEARIGALKTSVRNLIDSAELEYAKQLMIDSNPSLAFEDIPHKGQKFEKGKISFDANGQATIAVYENNICIYKSPTDKDVIVDKNITEEQCLGKLTAYQVGDKLKVDVGNGVTENIYVLEVKGNQIVGLLDRNLGNNVAWISEEDYNAKGGNWSSDSGEIKNQNYYKFGPVTANKQLNELTATWTNVTDKYIPSMLDVLKLTEFYQNLENKEEWESAYANRFMEIMSSGNEEVMNCDSIASCRLAFTSAGYGDILLPEWVTINLDTTGGSDDTFGYWLSTPLNYDLWKGMIGSSSRVGSVYPSGIASGYRAGDSWGGVRPVITINSDFVVPVLDSFETDSWETIANNIKSGKTYSLGLTKKLTIDGYGTFTVRVANNHNTEQCNIEGFSQTACGFVVEFVDIITTHNMNSTATNLGGWRDSEMRTFVNNNIYNALPEDLKNVIIDTKTLSGEGSSDLDDLYSTDKLYLLSLKEVKNIGPTYSGDSKSDFSRQLDYYAMVNSSESDDTSTIKKYNGVAFDWWLRPCVSSATNSFLKISQSGSDSSDIASKVFGISPAFRIG